MRESEAMAESECECTDPGCRCLLSEPMALLGRKYVMDVVCVVANHGTVRFGEIEAHLPGASTSTLSTRLDELVEAGLVERERYAEIPPRVEYELSDEGEELGERLQPLVEWAMERDEGCC
ncbi:winged helix-turn-helix transcriptional regulator [Halosimplex amylolyticum]|uniref:winged helix-turn-helix transcriptional regulator n=1 Tax=Halosimplex amylolyticum TaxID=3396616 RepID=UPI003F5769EB